jgi:hypothetical protein
MTTGAQFTVDSAAGEEFYVLVGETTTVYQTYGDALADIQAALEDDDSCLLAAVTVQSNGSEGVTVSIEQVGWQRILRDLSGTSEGENSTASEASGGNRD